MAAQSISTDSRTLRRLAQDEMSQYVLTEHAASRMRQRGITLTEIQQALRNAAAVSDEGQGIGSRSHWRVRGKTLDGTDLEFVVSFPEKEKTVHLLTVYSADALEELAGPAPSREAVQRRADDWSARIEVFYDQITSWLPAGWSAGRSGTVEMQEELMLEYNLPPRKLPKLDILKDTSLVGTIEPRGLWIIGTNGRLDFVLKGRRYVIIDMAKPFEIPQWQIAPLAHREKLQPLEREVFIRLLSDA
jgi:hypothetical protein